MNMLAVYRMVWRLRLMRLGFLIRGMSRRIWWIDRWCDVFGHPWKQRGENWAAMECSRCHRKRLMLWNTRTGESSWIVTL